MRSHKYNKARQGLWQKRCAHQAQKRRELVAEATHRAVCKFTNSNGFGRCVYYSIARAALARQLFKKTYYPQAGKLVVRCDPDSELCWGIDPTQHDNPSESTEFHCWIAAAPNPQSVEMVDLTTRHLRYHYDLSKQWTEVLPEWKLDVVPSFVWGKLPSWMHLEVDERTTTHLFYHIAECIEEFRDLKALAKNELEKLWNENSMGVSP